jgi:hypothetical protein
MFTLFFRLRDKGLRKRERELALVSTGYTIGVDRTEDFKFVHSYALRPSLSKCINKGKYV